MNSPRAVTHTCNAVAPAASPTHHCGIRSSRAGYRCPPGWSALAARRPGKASRGRQHRQWPFRCTHDGRTTLGMRRPSPVLVLILCIVMAMRSAAAPMSPASMLHGSPAVQSAQSPQGAHDCCPGDASPDHGPIKQTVSCHCVSLCAPLPGEMGIHRSTTAPAVAARTRSSAAPPLDAIWRPPASLPNDGS